MTGINLVDVKMGGLYQGHRQLNNQHVYLSYAFCNMNVIFAKFGVLTYPKVQKTFIHKTYHANY